MITRLRTGTPADALFDLPGCNFRNAPPLAPSHPGSTGPRLGHPTKPASRNSGFRIRPLEINLGGAS
ncbi:MAG: hypothetical protein H6R48_1218 [Proteobacteria bacterium]|jgi:hypothetical protein|nr:hypothetical protein [Pseudomonadota bacterium]